MYNQEILSVGATLTDEPGECSAKRSHLVQWSVSCVIHPWEGTFTVESGWGRGKSGCVQFRGEGGGRFPHQWYKSQQGEDIPGICLALLSLHCPNLSLVSLGT